MSFLSKLSQLKKTAPKTVISKDEEKMKPTDISLLPENYVREEDPAVRRLKELRRQEILKNPELAKKKKATPKRTSAGGSKSTKHDKNDDNMLVSRFKRKVGSVKPAVPMELKKKPDPIKKLSFEELMKQAENNNMSTATVNPPPTKPTLKTSSVPASSRLSKPGFKSSRTKTATKVKSTSPTVPEATSITSKKSQPKPNNRPAVKIGLPKFAQPNERIKKRLDKRKHQEQRRKNSYEYSDDDMDDFIEDDEEEDYRQTRDPGYDRDEIWAMFNKGRKRSYADYYEDEDEDEFDAMEANEMEILQEEEEATRMARLEDKREEAWLKKHEAEKRKKKLKSNK
ncbi:Protein SPT2 [Nakaseomyces bracarensis]|uniref:Protein SPT2 n=1 Tax=Nakaseomyces bracarensis TaxID=273131 RepID=A0ABR4NXD6_9SACH